MLSTVNNESVDGKIVVKKESVESSCSSSVEDSTVAIKIIQQRLLLLHHANNCKQDIQTLCTISPYCNYMRKLWPHILKCKEQKCIIPQCISSRYALSHYGNCENKICLICENVRHTMKIERNHERNQERNEEYSNNNSNNAKRQRTSYWWSKEQFHTKNIQISFQNLTSTTLNHNNKLNDLTSKFSTIKVEHEQDKE